MHNNTNPQKKPQDLLKAAKKGDVNSLISGLSDKDKQLLSRLMEDKTARENFLSSDEAKRIISELMNGR